MYGFEEKKFDLTTKRDMTLFGAFPGEGLVDFFLRINKKLIHSWNSIRSVSMVIHADGWNTQKTEYRSFVLEEVRDNDSDWKVFRIRIDFSALLRSFKLDGEGLFYYHYAVTRADGDFSDEVFYLGGEEPEELVKIENFVGERQLLVYRNGYRTSQRWTEGVIYHIFVDRFASSGKYPVKPRAEFDPDWDNGIPQYGPYPGAEVDNNVFFGGDLTGIEEKLPYIAALGVKTIYLSPIFEAFTNHKYDTADYMSVDSMFGGDEALRSLCKAAGKMGIGIILDGVFNHTGADSVYFNKFGNFDSVGAYQSTESPYYHWYYFNKHPDEYDSWWGVKVLPRLRSDTDEVRDFICGSVVPKWMDAGVAGWRLDVADELADSFLDAFRCAVKNNNGDAVVIGEVWEDASDKVSYGRRRRYFGGSQLDSVMNYPLRTAIIEYVKYGSCGNLRRFTEGLYRRYPKQSSDNLMNFLGTHDTERILTIFGGVECGDRSNEELSTKKRTEEERAEAVKKLCLAYGILAGLPGVPCVFYGDEAGSEGYRDPFCRRPFPWKNIEKNLLDFYRTVGSIRKTESVFRNGLFRILSLTDERIVYIREPFDDDSFPVIVAAVRKGSLDLSLPEGACVLCGNDAADGVLHLGEGDVCYCRLDKSVTAEALGI